MVFYLLVLHKVSIAAIIESTTMIFMIWGGYMYTQADHRLRTLDRSSG